MVRCPEGPHFDHPGGVVLLALVDKAAGRGCAVFLGVSPCGEAPSKPVVGAYGDCVFNAFRKLRPVFPLWLHQPEHEGSGFPTALSTLGIF